MLIQINFYVFSAVCCCFLAVAQAKPAHGHHHLIGVPDLADFSHITYPQLDVIDLGEEQKFVPEKEIKLVRTIKISEPYPVKVPVKVPYPVPVVKEVPVEVTKVVKIPEPVHVDVVKAVQIHSSTSAEQIHGSGPGLLHDHQWQASGSGPSGHDQAHFTSGDDGHGAESQQEYQPDYHHPDENNH